MTDGFSVAEVRVARIGQLGPNAVPSGIDKQPVIALAPPRGIDGDERGDMCRDAPVLSVSRKRSGWCPASPVRQHRTSGRRKW